MNVYWAAWKAAKSRPLAALSALYWHVTGRRVRARNRLRISLAQDPGAYALWIQTSESETLTTGMATAAMTRWHHRPTFSIIVHHTEDWTGSSLAALAAMMRAQFYTSWDVLIMCPPGSSRLELDKTLPIRVAEMHVADAGEALRAAADLAAGNYLLPLPPGAELPPAALYRFAEALQSAPEAHLLYGDNDWIDAKRGRHTPWFKTEWNSDLALAQDYLSQSMVIASDLVREMIKDGSIGVGGAYQWALSAAMKRPESVRHVPHILSHLPAKPSSGEAEARLPIVQDLLDRMKTGASASVGAHDTVTIEWPLPEVLPLVSIIIPTRDKVSLLRACVDSLLDQTSYRPFEVLIVDNGSQQPEALRYLEQIARHRLVRVLRDDRPYNFSQLNNDAARLASGEYLCLLNNDTEIVDGQWLTAMMRHAIRPEVGAVGARLLYADRSIQHAGVVVGMGEAAGHAHRFQKYDQPGYFARSHSVHRVSAVTAACLVVAKHRFLSVGGLDEEALSIAFNDVDLCLKLQAAGWQNIYTPEATLLHHESKSRGKDTSPRQIERFRRELKVLQERWGTKDYADPLHHPSLNRSSETFLIGVGPSSPLTQARSSAEPSRRDSLDGPLSGTV